MMSAIRTITLSSVLIISISVIGTAAAETCFFASSKTCPKYCCTDDDSKFSEYCCDDCKKSKEKHSLECSVGMSMSTLVSIAAAIFTLLFILLPLIICCVCCGLFARVMGRSSAARGRGGMVHQPPIAISSNAAYPRQQPLQQMMPQQVAHSSAAAATGGYPNQQQQPYGPSTAYSTAYPPQQPQPYGYATAVDGGAPPPAYSEVAASYPPKTDLTTQG